MLHVYGSKLEWLDDDAIRALGRRCLRPLLLPRRGRTPDARGPGRDGSRSAELASLSLPALVIHGSRDTLIDPSGGRQTASVIPGARYLEIDGMGHDYPPPVWTEWVDAWSDFARVVVRGPEPQGGDTRSPSRPASLSGWWPARCLQRVALARDGRRGADDRRSRSTRGRQGDPDGPVERRFPGHDVHDVGNGEDLQYPHPDSDDESPGEGGPTVHIRPRGNNHETRNHAAPEEDDGHQEGEHVKWDGLRADPRGQVAQAEEHWDEPDEDERTPWAGLARGLDPPDETVDAQSTRIRDREMSRSAWKPPSTRATTVGQRQGAGAGHGAGQLGDAADRAASPGSWPAAVEARPKPVHMTKAYGTKNMKRRKATAAASTPPPLWASRSTASNAVSMEAELPVGLRCPPWCALPVPAGGPPAPYGRTSRDGEPGG